MIEQRENQLILTFPNKDSATTFATFLATLLQRQPAHDSSEPPSDLPQPLLPEIPVSLEPGPLPAQMFRSKHTVLTDERLEALSRQREQGLTQHQREIRAQTTLRDGVLPFSKPGETPAPSGQASPRQKAQKDGGFADGAALPEAERRSKLRPVHLRTVLQPSPRPSKS